MAHAVHSERTINLWNSVLRDRGLVSLVQVIFPWPQAVGFRIPVAGTGRQRCGMTAAGLPFLRGFPGCWYDLAGLLLYIFAQKFSKNEKSDFESDLLDCGSHQARNPSIQNIGLFIQTDIPNVTPTTGNRRFKCFLVAERIREQGQVNPAHQTSLVSKLSQQPFLYPLVCGSFCLSTQWTIPLMKLD